MTVAEWQYCIEGCGVNLRRGNPVICSYKEHDHVKPHLRIWKLFTVRHF